MYLILIRWVTNVMKSVIHSPFSSLRVHFPHEGMGWAWVGWGVQATCKRVKAGIIEQSTRVRFWLPFRFDRSSWNLGKGGWVYHVWASFVVVWAVGSSLVFLQICSNMLLFFSSCVILFPRALSSLTFSRAIWSTFQMRIHFALHLSHFLTKTRQPPLSIFGWPSARLDSVSVVNCLGSMFFLWSKFGYAFIY